MPGATDSTMPAARDLDLMDATIHLRVPAVTKGRWIRASRAAGMRLTDWIVQAVEARMGTLHVNLPADIRFADLKLSRDRDGGVSFDTAPLEAIAAVSGPDVTALLHTEDGVSQLIAAWYTLAIGRGEPADPVADDIAAEVAAEDAAGQRVSLPPGRA